MRRILSLALVLALIMVAAMPTGIMGAGSDNGLTGVSGTIGATYSITVPGDITLGPFAAAQPYPDENNTVSATTNGSEATVDITVKDAKVNSAGYLTLDGEDAADATTLTNELQVFGGDIDSYTDLLGGAGNTLGDDDVLTSGSFSISDFGVRQTIVAGDLSKTAGSYELTLTFTATFN